MNEENMISKVEPCRKEEGEMLPRMCEIRFEAYVRMYDMGVDQRKIPLPFQIRREVPRQPQWFRNTQRLSLDGIKDADEYSIGARIKQQFQQLDSHIAQYEKYGKL